METLVPSIVCNNCETEHIASTKYCPGCGQRNELAIREETKKRSIIDTNIKFLSWYSILTVVFLIANALTEDTFEFLFIAAICFAIIDLIFAGLQSDVWRLFNIKSLRPFPAIVVVFTCIFSGFVVSYSVDKVNMALFQETTGYMHLFSNFDNPIIYAILLIAVFPAIFEELAFRGFVYNNLQKISGKSSALWGSTFLFAIIHLSLFSLFWIIPFGFILATLRRKYDTLWYGILGHFTHNTTIIVIEYYYLF